MEFLKTCITNAQAIGDFEAVAFQAFSVTRNTDASPSLVDRSPAEDLHAVEAEFRQGQHLVVQDASKSLLWFFRATTADKAGQTPLALPVLPGYDFQAEQSGVMKASELARPPMRNVTSSTPSSNSPLTPGALKGPGFLGGNGRGAQGTPQAAQPLDQQLQHDSYAIYELFTSSVVALISFYMVRDHKAIALNYRTLLSMPAAQQDPDQDPSNSSGMPFCLTNVNVYWTSSGTLVISIFSVSKAEIHRLDGINSEEAQKQFVGRCVRVAPNGLLAKIVGFESFPDVAAEDVSQRGQRKRVRIGPVEQSIERWKSLVTRWLKWKGYSIPDLEEKTSWVKIRIARSNQFAASSPAPGGQAREVLWPRALCFFYDELSSAGDVPDTARIPQKDTTLDWYETNYSSGFRDPIDVAQQWFMGKPERDKALEARRKAQKAEEEAAQLKGDSHGLLPSSPLNSRTGTYGDLQAVSGVYPTPPDGVAPGVGMPSSDNAAIPGAAPNTILVPSGSNPAINLSGPHDHIPTDTQQLPVASPELPLPFDPFSSTLHGGNDDLFEDLDEDGFGGNDITDADFNFFDEPDENEDVDMLGSSAAPDSKPPSQEKAGKDPETSSLPDADIKEEMSDPMTALDDALAAAPRPSNQPNSQVKIETQADEQAPQPGAQAEQPISQPTQSTDPSIISVKLEPSPPLSPHLVQQKLLPSPKEKLRFQTPKQQITSRHRDSIFDPVSFNRKMSLSDAKYHEGRFSFPLRKPKETSVSKEPTKRPASLRELPLLTKLRHAIGMASAKSIVELKTVVLDESDLSDSSSETPSTPEDEPEDMVSTAPEPLSAGLYFPGKRKLPTDGDATPMSATSFAESFGGDMQDIASLQTDESCLAWFEPNPSDWCLAYVPAPAELPLAVARNDVPAFSPIIPSMPDTPTSQPDLQADFPDEKPLSPKDSIAVAQIVTDQIVSATLDILHEGSSTDTTPHLDRTCSETKATAVVKTIFPKAADCNVLSLASVQDVFPDLPQQSKGQPRPAPRRMNAQTDGSASPGHLIYQIPSPHIRVRRADTLWDLLPPALSFWEPLGLAPCNPAKNVVAFCIYPQSHSLTSCLESFLVNIQIAYESCKFGNHTRIQTVPEYEGGLVPCTINGPTSARAAFRVLRETCTQLGKLLAVKHAQMREKGHQKINAFVIYMIDPFESPSALWELCSAFWSLFQAYGQVSASRPGSELPPKPDLVLQIIPIKYIASFDVPVVLDSSTYTSLAREVYDRCPPSAPSEDKTPLTIYTAPSFQLEEAIPRTIPFKLNAEPPQDLLRENSYIHLGYAISLDGTWITAAWTDSCGKSQAVVSYNLGTRVFGEIAKEIWQTTVEILQARRVTWRVCIAKAGVMEREELETWVFLASCPTQLNLFITLLTVDTKPPLRFTPTIPTPNSLTSNANSATAQHLSSNTPGSTPQAAGGLSPDHPGLTPAATPSDSTNDPSNDPEARLINVTDESWGVILSHRLHNSNSTVEFRPCLISGLLVKRGETYSTSRRTTQGGEIPDPERGPIVVGVNILWVGAVGSTRAAQSPFPPSASGAEGVSPGGTNLTSNTSNPHLNSNPPNTSGAGIPERSSTSLMWTPTAQSRATAENLLKEVLAQFRALGLLARLKGMRGTRGGTVPWHVGAAMRGVGGVVKCLQ
ncbi:uncharacterized protein BDR25DRAFT_284183 [Lindgomyces ingoldianus]|uniref:Uncharacterized protein n=1 Tax=Lindgomyces ingoldianus TaxID=673940 RepID=A0ACB6R0G1_9PLEO|nr:uncharacterized protein BDR25DRAFT_284183 [Lindgomyces ingoldianus]KAF2472631.1 hypothetical protein BDR25DRAFT_284183 [Lindgomyces ingoldianus]